MVCPNFELVPHAFKEMLLFFKGADNGEHLFIMDLVVPFYCIEALRVEGYGMLLTVLLEFLRKNCPCGEVRAVSFDMEGRIVVREEEDQLGGDGLFEGVEGVLLWCFPLPHAIFNYKIKEWMQVVREVLDEPLVEVGEAQEGLHFLLVLWL